MPRVSDQVERRFVDLLAKIQPFDLVIDEHTADGHEARVSKTSVAGSWGAISGTLRYFADAYGNPRAAIEGTNVPMTLIRRYATSSAPDAGVRRAAQAVAARDGAAGRLLRVRAGARARGGPRVSRPGWKPRRAACWPKRWRGARRGTRRCCATGRRSRRCARRTAGRAGDAAARPGGAHRAGTTPSCATRATCTSIARRRCASTPTRSCRAAERARLSALPGAAEVRDRTVPMHYEIEDTPDGPLGVVRLVIPEKVARGLAQEELPALDRPVRFTVTRGARGSVKAASLERDRRRARAAVHGRRSAEAADDEARTDRAARILRAARRRRGMVVTIAAGVPAHQGKPGGHDKASHRPGSPSGRGKRRGKRR